MGSILKITENFTVPKYKVKNVTWVYACLKRILLKATRTVDRVFRRLFPASSDEGVVAGFCFVLYIVVYSTAESMIYSAPDIRMMSRDLNTPCLHSPGRASPNSFLRHQSKTKTVQRKRRVSPAGYFDLTR